MCCPWVHFLQAQVTYLHSHCRLVAIAGECVALTGDPYAVAGDLWRVFHAGLNLSRRQRVQRPFDRTSVAHLAQRSTSSASDVAIAGEDDATADDDACRSWSSRRSMALAVVGEGGLLEASCSHPSVVGAIAGEGVATAGEGVAFSGDGTEDEWAARIGCNPDGTSSSNLRTAIESVDSRTQTLCREPCGMGCFAPGSRCKSALAAVRFC